MDALMFCWPYVKNVPMLACHYYCSCIYTLGLCGFIWKLPKYEPARPWSFCFPKLQTGVHPSFLFLFLNHCSFMLLLCLNSTWTKCHNFLLHFADHNKNLPLRCSLEMEHKGNKWTPVSFRFLAVRHSSVFWPRKIGPQISEGNTAVNCKLYKNFDLHSEKWSISIAYRRCYNKKKDLACTHARMHAWTHTHACHAWKQCRQSSLCMKHVSERG